MAIFSVGGNLGMALGPIFALTLIQAFGPRGTAAMVVPGIPMAGALLLSPSWKNSSHSFPFRAEEDRKERTSFSENQTVRAYPDWDCDFQILDSTWSAGPHPVLLHRHSNTLNQ